MSLLLTCHTCGAKIKAPDQLAGKVVSCPNCQQSIQVPLTTTKKEPDKTASALPEPIQPPAPIQARPPPTSRKMFVTRDPEAGQPSRSRREQRDDRLARSDERDEEEQQQNDRETYEDDHPPSKPRAPAWLLMLSIVGGFSLLAVLAVAGWFVLHGPATTNTASTTSAVTSAGDRQERRGVDEYKFDEEVSHGDLRITITQAYPFRGSGQYRGQFRGRNFFIVTVSVKNTSTGTIADWPGWYGKATVEDEHGNKFAPLDLSGWAWLPANDPDGWQGDFGARIHPGKTYVNALYHEFPPETTNEAIVTVPLAGRTLCFRGQLGLKNDRDHKAALDAKKGAVLDAKDLMKALQTPPVDERKLSLDYPRGVTMRASGVVIWRYPNERSPPLSKTGPFFIGISLDSKPVRMGGTVAINQADKVICYLKDKSLLDTIDDGDVVALQGILERFGPRQARTEPTGQPSGAQIGLRDCTLTPEEAAKPRETAEAFERRRKAAWEKEKESRPAIPEARVKLDWNELSGLKRRDVLLKLQPLRGQVVEVTGTVYNPTQPGIIYMMVARGSLNLTVRLAYKEEGRLLKASQVVVVVGEYRSDIGGHHLANARVKRYMSQEEYRREAKARSSADMASRPDAGKKTEPEKPNPEKGYSSRPAPPEADVKLDWNQIPQINVLNRAAVYTNLASFDGKLVEVTGWAHVYLGGSWSLRNVEKGGPRGLVGLTGDSVLQVFMTYPDERMGVEAGHVLVVVGEFQEATSDNELRRGLRVFKLINARMKRVMTDDDYKRELAAKLKAEKEARARAKKEKKDGADKDKTGKPLDPKIAKMEAKAKVNLDYAKQMIEERQSEKAKKRLEQIIKNYPDTPSAEEAKRLLKELFP
jgi:hypothetical protein